jgi:hypothetical protein
MLFSQELRNGLHETPLQQILKSTKRNRPAFAPDQFERQVKAVDRIQKEKGSHAMIKVRTLAAELIQPLARLQQLLTRHVGTLPIERLISYRRILGEDQLDQIDAPSRSGL